MRIGVFQCAGGGLTPSQRLARLGEALKSRPLEFVVCPELFMSGYDVGQRLVEQAETCGGPFARQISALAQASGTAIVFGYPEKDDGKLYNAAACVDARGRIVANHRKLLLPPGFESKYFSPGDKLTLFDLYGVRYSILICYDAEYPEAVRAATEAGAEVVVVPTALARQWEVVAFQMMPTRAFENGVWFVYANHCGSEGRTSYLGASCIVAPSGQIVARATIDEVLLGSDIDIAEVAVAQARLPYVKEVARLRTALATLCINGQAVPP